MKRKIIIIIICLLLVTLHQTINIADQTSIDTTSIIKIASQYNINSNRSTFTEDLS